MVPNSPLVTLLIIWNLFLFILIVLQRALNLTYSYTIKNVDRNFL